MSGLQQEDRREHQASAFKADQYVAVGYRFLCDDADVVGVFQST